MESSRLRVAHTADLTAGEIAAARGLIFTVFDDATESDWEHCLGGIHAFVTENDELVAHGSVIQRRLIYKDRALRTGYVEAVAVRADRRRQGLGGAVMSELERVIRSAYELGALGSTDEGLTFYRARGWRQWQGKTCALTPDGIVPTPDDDAGIFVLPVADEIDVTSDLCCDFRLGGFW